MNWNLWGEAKILNEQPGKRKKRFSPPNARQQKRRHRYTIFLTICQGNTMEKDFYELRATIRAGSIEGIEVLVTNLFASIIQRGDKNLDAYCDNNKNFEWWITKI